MKKHLLGIFALALSIGFSSFDTMKITNYHYLIFTPTVGSTNEILQTNYTDYGTALLAIECEGNAKVCWIRVDDTNFNGIIDIDEFSAQVVPLDTDFPRNNRIADDQVPNEVSYAEGP
ncbi:hypothetical protein HB364_16635 [Pseudoflavitalea sp. X16]|uniref:hypothetical protein n=1 Tax=Paraflavitalea devenefica TaxID=2716334 RepID=UPI0014246ACE|nr:hypothetical protein [Paraflavitalea devenefica]NII26717.1 hypothetical protein [Paraflavitalea devenefica]